MEALLENNLSLEIPARLMRKIVVAGVIVIGTISVIMTPEIKDAIDPLCSGFSVKVCPAPPPPLADAPHDDHTPLDPSSVKIARMLSPTTIEFAPAHLPIK